MVKRFAINDAFDGKTLVTVIAVTAIVLIVLEMVVAIDLEMMAIDLEMIAVIVVGMIVAIDLEMTVLIVVEMVVATFQTSDSEIHAFVLENADVLFVSPRIVVVRHGAEMIDVICLETLCVFVAETTVVAMV